MKTWQLTNLSGRTLRQVNASLETGLHVLLTLDTTGTSELIPMLDGSTAPRSGRALLDGKSPYRSPEVRRHIGSLWSEEALPTARDLRESLKRLELEPKLIEATFDELERLGLASLQKQSVSQFSSNQVRGVALALALSKPELWSLLLHEPFLAVAANREGIVAETLLRMANHVPVVVVTASRTTAMRLGGPTAELGGGFIRRTARGRQDGVTIRIAGTHLRSLAAELLHRPRVHSLRLTRPSEGTDEVWLETSDPSSVVLDITRIALQLGAKIWSMDTRMGTG